MLERKVAVVTGGTKGIGFCIVAELLSRGYYVYTNYAEDVIAADKAERHFLSISEEFRIVRADQSDKAAFSQFVEIIKRQEKRIHCIICNAGMTIRKPTMALTDEEWERVMQVSVNAHFYLIRDIYSLIADDSRIVFIGSAMGIYPHSVSLPYGVCKSAIHAMAKNLVKEFAGTKTTVNAIAPGFVETEWQKEKPRQIKESICGKTAAERFADPNEIVSAVMFCMDNPYVNGAVIEVNGGYCYK